MVKNEDSGYLLHVIVVVLAALLIRDIYWFVRSLRFYKKNGWDLTVKFGPKMYKGDGEYPDFEMSPREKLAHGYPMGIFIYAVLLAGSTAALLLSGKS